MLSGVEGAESRGGPGHMSQHSVHAEGESFSVTDFDPFLRILWMEVRFFTMGTVEYKNTVFSPMSCPVWGALF